MAALFAGTFLTGAFAFIGLATLVATLAGAGDATLTGDLTTLSTLVGEEGVVIFNFTSEECMLRDHSAATIL